MITGKEFAKQFSIVEEEQKTFASIRQAKKALTRGIDRTITQIKKHGASKDNAEIVASYLKKSLGTGGKMTKAAVSNQAKDSAVDKIAGAFVKRMDKAQKVAKSPIRFNKQELATIKEDTKQGMIKRAEAAREANKKVINKKVILREKPLKPVTPAQVTFSEKDGKFKWSKK